VRWARLSSANMVVHQGPSPAASLLLLLIVGASVASAASNLDLDLSDALANSLDSDSIAISIKNIRPAKHHLDDDEHLLSAYVKSALAFDVALNRKAKRITVTIDTEEKGINISSLKGDETLSSIVIIISEKKRKDNIKIYIDCQFEGSATFVKSLSKFIPQKDHFLVRRPLRYDVELDTNTKINEVLSRHKCKRDTMMAIEPQPPDEEPYVPPRGDIPIIHDCDDALLIKTINELIATVKRLQEDLERQRIETRNLRQLLEQCDVCRPGEGY